MLTSITVRGTVLRRLQNTKDLKRKYMQNKSLGTYGIFYRNESGHVFIKHACFDLHVHVLE